MHKSRFSEAQIAILREFATGAPAQEFACRHGSHPNTIRLCPNRVDQAARESVNHTYGSDAWILV